ncbi:hypothetical protein JXO59_00165 [candidate division KSB1 bacterium]|nr:hypothetical protein [candidate division KSB1 bacterium]
MQGTSNLVGTVVTVPTMNGFILAAAPGAVNGIVFSRPEPDASPGRICYTVSVPTGGKYRMAFPLVNGR